MARVTKKATVQSVTLKHINEKLDHIKQQVAMGKGGIKVIFYIGAIVSIIIGALKIGKIL